MAIAGNISFLCNGYELATALRSYHVKLNMPEVDASVLANNFREYEAGYADASLDASGKFQHDGTNLNKIHNIFSASMSGRTTSNVTASLGAITVGAIALMMNACQNAYEVPLEVGNLILSAAGFRSKTGLDFGKWLMNSQLNAGTTNGTSVDNTAASTNGGFFQVHLQNVDATDVDVKLQHSILGSIWVDLAAVNNLSADNESGSATVAAGTSVFRYTRAVATVTGGNTTLVSAAFARR